MTKWEMTNMLIDDNDTIFLPQHSRMLMKRPKSYLETLINILSAKEQNKKHFMFRWNLRGYVEGSDKIEEWHKYMESLLPII